MVWSINPVNWFSAEVKVVPFIIWFNMAPLLHGVWTAIGILPLFPRLWRVNGEEVLKQAVDLFFGNSLSVQIITSGTILCPCVWRE